MRDIVITGKRIKIELLFLLGAWVFANLLNIYSIWVYGSSWIELITFQPMMMMLAVIFYVAIGIVRMVFGFSRMIVKRFSQ